MTTLDLMHDQVRAIYRALTGEEFHPSKKETSEHAPARDGEALTVDLVAQRFADLDAIVRTIPNVGERIPPFSFTPAADVIEEGDQIIVELDLPGVEPHEVTVEVSEHGDQVLVRGVRNGEQASNGRAFWKAEMARGPFRRVLQLPVPVNGSPRVDADRGLIRIHLSKAQQQQQPH
jgi:HSP20 family molecular chaperone IbpA